MNMLSGLLEPTSGEIWMNGEKVNITSPTAANKLGIGMVHQHFMLVDAFTVTENIILGSEPHHLGVRSQKARKEIKKFLNNMVYRLIQMLMCVTSLLGWSNG